MPTPGGVMVWRSVCAPWVSLWVWLLMGVKVARLVGDGVAVGVRPNAVRVWLPMVCSCSDRGEGVAAGVACLLIA